MAVETTAQLDAWVNVRNIHREWSGFYQDLSGLGLVGLFVALGLIWFAADRLGYATNIYTEALSVIVTIAYLDRRAERRATKLLQEQLIREVGGRANNTALAALDHMREKDWLHLLRDVDLENANLSGADLSEMVGGDGVDLSNKYLSDANLSRSNLFGVNFDDIGADRLNLSYCDLRHASFNNAWTEDLNLRGSDAASATFRHATLERANLSNGLFSNADFCGANLDDAELTGARFSEFVYQFDRHGNDSIKQPPAKFDETTRLPDGSMYDPSLGLEQLERFTNPDHLNYWRSDFRHSPAYRGDNTDKD